LERTSGSIPLGGSHQNCKSMGYYNPNHIEHSEKDLQLLREAQVNYNEVDGPRVGDYVKYGAGKYQRFTHKWNDSIQAGASADNVGFYLSGSSASYSGGLNEGVKFDDLIETNELKDGYVWFFHDGWAAAHSAVYFEIPFRVFALKPGAAETGLYNPYGGQF